MALSNPQNTFLSYRDGFWTSEKGASKFMANVVRLVDDGYGGYGAVLNGFTLTPTSPAALAINVAASDNGENDGHILIGYEEYAYFGWLSQNTRIELEETDQYYARISLIVAYIDLSLVPESPDEKDKEVESPGALKIVEVAGIPSSYPTAPSASAIQSQIGVMNPYLVIGVIRVPGNATMITSDNITSNSDSVAAQLNPSIRLDSENSYCAGVLQANEKNTKTRIVVTGPTASQPEPIEGVEIIWLKKKL